MRLVRADTDVLLALSSREASQLMDACAMVVLAADSVPNTSLHPEMAALLQQLFATLGDPAPDLSSRG